MIQIKNKKGEVIAKFQNLADLSEADLRGANLREADLRGANLREADLREANLSEADLYGANLRGADLYGADLSGADLREADLYGADLSGADLSEANLYGADLEIISIGPIGSRNGFTYFAYRLDNIRCGCFTGTLAEFEKTVNAQYEVGHKYRIQYAGAINYFKTFVKNKEHE